MNEPPIFDAGGYPLGLPLSEATAVGTQVFTLKGHDPEGSEVKYGIQSTDKFTVDPTTGIITLAKPLDREVSYKIIFPIDSSNSFKSYFIFYFQFNTKKL